MPIDHVYTCRFEGGPFDGLVEDCTDIHDEAKDLPSGQLAIYFRHGPETKRFLGYTRDPVEGCRMCEDERERLALEFCDGV